MFGLRVLIKNIVYFQKYIFYNDQTVLQVKVVSIEKEYRLYLF